MGKRLVDFWICWSFFQFSMLLLTFCWRLSQMLSIAVSSLAQLSLYISLTLYYTESKGRDARAQRFAKSKLEGVNWGILEFRTNFIYKHMFCSSHILSFGFWYFGLFSCVVFFLVFFCLANLTLPNVNKDYLLFLYFLNFVAKCDQKPKTKNGMNETIEF